MPPSCAATLLFLRERHPYVQLSLLSWRSRRCKGRARSERYLRGFIGVHCFIGRNIPVEPSVSNTNKFSDRSNFWSKYSGTHTENLVDILKSPRQKLHTDRSTTTQTWRNYSDSGPCRVSSASCNHQSIRDSFVHPTKP